MSGGCSSDLEFVDDQADGDGEVDRNDHFGQVVEQFFPRLGCVEHVSDPPAEVADIAAELDPGDVLAMIQMVVDQAQRADAPGQGRQFALRFRTLGTRTLERNEAADDLEVVLHTMVNLSEQHLLLVEVGTELFVGRDELFLAQPELLETVEQLAVLLVNLGDRIGAAPSCQPTGRLLRLGAQILRWYTAAAPPCQDDAPP